MNKSLKVAKNRLPKGAAMEEVLNYSQSDEAKANIPYTVNWKEYPYCPEVSFKIAHNGDEIFLQFNV
ncbi:MAG: hypothetical protein KBS58_03910, partial [Bacteroidales bacterium]|nr:hypothetical protein [Candidatus Cacconaster equi]